MEAASPEKSASLIVLLTALVSLSLFSTDIYLPSLPEMAEVFHTSVAEVQMTLSSYMLGFALSMLLCGAISDRFGRRPVVLIGTATHCLASIVCLLSTSLTLIVTARFFQALGGCCGTVLGRVIVRDLFDKGQCVKILSFMATGMSLSPALAPILGGYLQNWFGWKASFAALSLSSGAIFIIAWFLLHESLPCKNYVALKPKTLFRNYMHVLRSRLFTGYTLTITFAWCGYFSFITASPFVFIQLMGNTPQKYGILYALVVAGYLAGTYIAGKLSSRLPIRQSVYLGAWLALLGGIGMVVLDAWFPLSLPSIMAPMLLFLIGIGIIMPNAQTAATDPFPELVGSAASLLYFIEMMGGAIAGSIVSLLSRGSHLSMVAVTTISSLLLFAAFWTIIWAPCRKRKEPSAD